MFLCLIAQFDGVKSRFFIEIVWKNAFYIIKIEKTNRNGRKKLEKQWEKVSIQKNRPENESRAHTSLQKLQFTFQKTI